MVAKRTVHGYTRHQKSKTVRVKNYKRQSAVKSYRRKVKKGSSKKVPVSNYTRKATVKGHTRRQRARTVSVKGYRRKK